jgi:hypothetical protein
MAGSKLSMTVKLRDVRTTELLVASALVRMLIALKKSMARTPCRVLSAPLKVRVLALGVPRAKPYS